MSYYTLSFCHLPRRPCIHADRAFSIQVTRQSQARPYALAQSGLCVRPRDGLARPGLGRQYGRYMCVCGGELKK